MFRLLQIASQQFSKTCLILGFIILPSFAEIIPLQLTESVSELPQQCTDEVDKRPWNITTILVCENQSQAQVTFEEEGSALSDGGDYYILFSCSNVTHHVVPPTDREFFSTLMDPISYKIPFLSGSVTCTVTGCYRKINYDDFINPSTTYELKANSCLFPLPTTTPAISFHTTQATASMVSTPAIPFHTTSTTAFMVSTPTITSQSTSATASMVFTPTITSQSTSATASMVSTPTITSQSTSATAHGISTSRSWTSTTPMTSHQTTALSKPSPSLDVGSLMDDKQENMFSLLLIFSLPLTLIAIFMMSCVIISLRRRKVTKQLADWRTGYGLQLKENQKTFEIDTSFKLSLKAPPSPSRSIYTLLHYEVDTQMTPRRNSLSTPSSSLNSLNLCTTSVIQNDIPSEPEQANVPYITSLAYDENQPMPIIDLSEYEHLFSQPSTSTTNLAQSTSKMVASHSVPIFLDQLQNDYIEALAYSSSEAINAENRKLSPTELAVAHSSSEVQSDGYLDVSSKQQPKARQTLGGEMNSDHDVNYQRNSEGYVYTTNFL